MKLKVNLIITTVIPELSEVLWHMVFAQCFAFTGWLGSFVAFVAFAFFAILTFSILVVMEGLSAFLHALRLHWFVFNDSESGAKLEPLPTKSQNLIGALKVFYCAVFFFRIVANLHKYVSI